MAFKPFGKGFEINTHLSVDEVREAIYRRQHNRFDSGFGPSALVLGSVILLWLPSVGYGVQDQLVCRVATTPQGSRTRGRLGFGILYTWAMAAALGGAAIVAILMGRINAIEALFAACLPLLLFAFNDTKCAEPLMRYLQNCLDYRSGMLAMPSGFAKFSHDLALEVGGTTDGSPVTPQTILDALLLLQESEASTLFLYARGVGSLKATPQGGDFALERRSEGEAGYQRASRRGAGVEGNDRLSRDQALTAFLRYAAGEPFPDTIEWRQVAPRHV